MNSIDSIYSVNSVISVNSDISFPSLLQSKGVDLNLINTTWRVLLGHDSSANSANSVNSVNSVSSVNSINSIQAVYSAVLPPLECNEKTKSFYLKIPQPDSERRHSLDFRTVFGIMIGPFSFCEFGET